MIEISERTLEIQKAARRGIRKVIPDTLMEAGLARLDVVAHTAQGMALEIERDVYSETIKTERTMASAYYTVPATWWDMWKRDRAPRWLQRWLRPPRTITKTLPIERRIEYTAEFPGYCPPTGHNLAPVVFRVYDTPQPLRNVRKNGHE